MINFSSQMQTEDSTIQYSKSTFSLVKFSEFNLDLFFKFQIVDLTTSDQPFEQGVAIMSLHVISYICFYLQPDLSIPCSLCRQSEASWSLGRDSRKR